MTHPLREFQQARCAELWASGGTTKVDSPDYSRELFVRERLLEFPFEEYPDYCYPGDLLRWEHMRWDHVEQTIRFCESLNQPKGSRAGTPVRLLGFQILILVCILGPEDPEARLRLARTGVMTIARKNGKSSLIAMLYLAMMSLGCFNLRAQDIQVGASDREQAGILFDLIQKLILLDTNLGLVDLYHIVPSKKVIVNKRTFPKLHCLSSDAYRAHGANPQSVLIDEAGNIPDNKAREFYGVLSTAFGSQLEPLMLLFSTQAPSDEHLFSEFVDRAAKANLGKSDDDGLIGFLFDLPKEDDGTGLVLLDDGKTVDHFCEQNWKRPNPALEELSPGGFRSIDDLRRKAKEAAEMPSLENNFRNLQLNQRIQTYSPFLSQQAWARCTLLEPVSEEALDGAGLFIGVDLSRTTDLSVLVLAFAAPDGYIYVRYRFYMPRANLETRAKQDKVPYDTWAKQGHIHLCKGSSIDHRQIAQDIVDLDDKYAIQAVSFDRYDFDLIRKECSALEFDPYEVEPGEFWKPIGQGFIGMAPCIDALEKQVIEETLRSEPNPVMTWNMANAVTVVDDAGNRKLSKQKSYGRIDAVVALAMAVFTVAEDDRASRSGELDSVFENADAGMLM